MEWLFGICLHKINPEKSVDYAKTILSWKKLKQVEY